MTITAAAVVPASPDAVFAFLADLENHWALADRFVEVVTLERNDDGPAHGGVVRMHGPLGTRRTARTRVVEADAPRSMSGVAELSGGTCASVSWTLVPQGDTTRVDLAARVERASPLDRALLALGGGAWLRRRLAAILAMLAQRFATTA